MHIAITKHARARLSERGITFEDLKNAIITGEIIEQYEEDKPFPSCLLIGITEQNKHIHVVASSNDEWLYIITAYHPNEKGWEADLKTRKGRS